MKTPNRIHLPRVSLAGSRIPLWNHINRAVIATILSLEASICKIAFAAAKIAFVNLFIECGCFNIVGHIEVREVLDLSLR